MRAAACLVLAGGCAYMGAASVLEARRRARLLLAFVSALDVLKREICSRLTPLPDCVERLARGGPEPLRGFFTALCALFPQLGELGLGEIWRRCLEPLDLPGAAREALSELGGALGRYDAAAQGVAIDRCRETLAALAARESERSAERDRLRLGLALCAGALLALTLY